jgi:hypothetical protein
MDKIIGYLLLVFRLTFLPLTNHVITRKWKITLLLITNIVVMYAVFIISIHGQKSKFSKVDEVYGAEHAALDMQERKLENIIFKNARRINPQMIRIVPTAILEAENKQDSINRANALSIEDQIFLLEIAIKGKDTLLY